MIEKQLGDIVGAANVLTAPQDTRPYFTDWRRQYTGSAECVVRPASTAEVAMMPADGRRGPTQRSWRDRTKYDKGFRYTSIFSTPGAMSGV